MEKKCIYENINSSFWDLIFFRTVLLEISTLFPHEQFLLLHLILRLLQIIAITM